MLQGLIQEFSAGGEQGCMQFVYAVMLLHMIHWEKSVVCTKKNRRQSFDFEHQTHNKSLLIEQNLGGGGSQCVPPPPPILIPVLYIIYVTKSLKLNSDNFMTLIFAWFPMCTQEYLVGLSMILVQCTCKCKFT